jgi:hypothetical protein
MKKLNAILILALALTPAAFAQSRLEATVNAMNYPLHQVFMPHITYAGVLVDARTVTVKSGPKGLIGGLTLGMANVLLGTQLGDQTVTVHQYVVRLDAVRGGPAELITVVQGGPELYQPGIPVFLSTETDYSGYIYSVRMIPANVPEAYGTKGLEEARLEHLRALAVAAQPQPRPVR